VPATEASTVSAQVCSICQTPIAADEAKTACPACAAEYHAGCWEENNGCAVYGCSEVPVVEMRQSIEIPISYWGQENKPCPSCGREILAAAVRCRYCGATFSSASPEDAGEFQERRERNRRLPGVRRAVIWLFVGCVVPCLAPIGLLWGGIWYARNRDDVLALPSLYAALCKIGLGVAIVQVAGIALMALIHAVFTSI